ncbi:hypothetical protein [Bradyrhizobium ottawaense]|uniref:hypothetical protein n=1 Tax=Bradyrhizobium ottawaense TaxID=931866 RepID=UPI0030F4107C
MKKRYSIWVREIGSDHDVELMQCDSNPQALKAAAWGKRISTAEVGKRSRKKLTQSRYVTVRIIDNETGQEVS